MAGIRPLTPGASHLILEWAEAFAGEEFAFDVRPPGKAANAAAGRDDPVRRHQHHERVVAAGSTGRSRGPREAGHFGEFSIRHEIAPRHAFVESAEDCGVGGRHYRPVQWDIEATAVSLQKLLDLRRNLMPQGIVMRMLLQWRFTSEADLDHQSLARGNPERAQPRVGTDCEIHVSDEIDRHQIFFGFEDRRSTCVIRMRTNVLYRKQAYMWYT